MLTREDIINYHAKKDAPTRYQGIGLELELFPIDDDFQRVLYENPDKNKPSVVKIFDFLVEKHDWKKIDPTKTFGIEKKGRKITVEPGGQVEFVSHVHEHPAELLKDFFLFYPLIKDIGKECGVHFLDIAHYPLGRADDIPTIENPRYQVMEARFKEVAKYGQEMMKWTTSLQVAFDYTSVEDMEEKVRRLLLLKPILLPLTANSRLNMGKDSGKRSFREIIWENTDPSRCGTPGPETIWQTGRWSLDDYVEKMLNAEILFDVVDKKYTKVDRSPFSKYMNRAGLEGYIFHNNTTFPDIRIKQYVELRYMDNPGIEYIPGILILLYDLVYNDDTWNELEASLPYSFGDVPAISQLMNTINDTSIDYWKTKIQAPLLTILERYAEKPENESFLKPLIEKAKNIDAEFETTRPLGDDGILKYHREKFVREIDHVLHERRKI